MTARTGKPTAERSGDPVADAQADVDRIREDLADTVDALVAKTDVAARAKEAGSRVSGQVGDAAGRVREASASIAGDGHERVRAAGEQMHDRFATLRDDVRENGVTSRLRSPAAAVAFGVVAAALVAGVVMVLRRRR